MDDINTGINVEKMNDSNNWIFKKSYYKSRSCQFFAFK